MEICRLYELDNVSANIMKVNMVSNGCTALIFKKIKARRTFLLLYKNRNMCSLLFGCFLISF